MLQGSLLLDKFDWFSGGNPFLPDFSALTNNTVTQAVIRNVPAAEQATRGILKLSKDNFLLIGAILFFLSIIFSRTISRTGIPILALFLFVGFLAGEYGLDFSSVTVARALGDFALIFILFYGGLETKFYKVRPVFARGIVLSTVGVLMTAGILGSLTKLLFPQYFSWPSALLLGSIVSSTDAASVFGIFRTRNLDFKNNLRPLLELESGSNDPMAYFLTVTCIDLVQGQCAPGNMILTLLQGMIVGALTGFILGHGMSFIMRRIRLEADGLYSVLVISMTMIVYSAAEHMGGNCFLAVYISAMVLGNANIIHKRSMSRFFDGFAWLMQITMFIMLGLLAAPFHRFKPYIGYGLAVSAILMFVARPISVFLCLHFFKMSVKDKLFVSWVGLRGAVPIVFATYPLVAFGVDDPMARALFFVVCCISFSSVLLQGSSLVWAGKLFDVTVPQTKSNTADFGLEVSDTFQSHLDSFTVRGGDQCINRSLLSMSFPKNCLIMGIKRGADFITPNGSTIIQEGDELLIMAASEEKMSQMKMLLHGVREGQ